MDDGTVYNVLAQSFEEAITAWSQFGKDPAEIWAIEQHH